MGLVSAAWAWLQRQRVESIVPAHTYRLQADSINEWTRFGGSWEISDGAVRSDSYERGAKLLAGSRHWSNYTVNTDIQFNGPAADMGVVIRTNDETEGVDSYNGYFVGLRSLDGTLVMGRADYAWIEVLPVTMPGGISSFQLVSTASHSLWMQYRGVGNKPEDESNGMDCIRRALLRQERSFRIANIKCQCNVAQYQHRAFFMERL